MYLGSLHEEANEKVDLDCRPDENKGCGRNVCVDQVEEAREHVARFPAKDEESPVQVGVRDGPIEVFA